jgi:hypothetical protein
LLFRHFPHLDHVLVINEFVEFWDKFGSEKGAVWQCVSLTPPGWVLM